jgi:hypothetical protein
LGLPANSGSLLETTQTNGSHVRRTGFSAGGNETGETLVFVSSRIEHGEHVAGSIRQENL